MYSAKKVRFPIQIRHAAQAVAPLSPTKKPRVCGIFSTERARVSLLACGLRFREPSGSRITLLKMRETPVSRPLPRSNLAPISNEKYLAKSEISFKRRGRDLNSRGFLRPATLAVWCLQPLGHLSKIFSRQSLDQKIVPRVCRGFFLKPVRCSLARIRPTRPPLQNIFSAEPRSKNCASCLPGFLFETRQMLACSHPTHSATSPTIEFRISCGITF